MELKMYKLCFVADTLPFCHTVFSGAELSCEYIAKEFENDHTEIVYLTSRKDYECKEKVYELPRCKQITVRGRCKYFLHLVNPKILFQVLQVLKKEQPDYVYLYTKQYLHPLVIACFLLRIPLVYSVVDYHMQKENGFVL